ncbi:MAG: hypothetical protein Q3M24_09260 [Candidatus Electrothrix aestuarii]|uniref:Uncharacterized protein n=1 Tax=Candidatus Electrothrix aestuarii TaxID=3062594 RepID=A0AAU8M1A9_9BACT|nr:hypothetical protein [Candidatus Electrothrix aestuarii]
MRYFTYIAEQSFKHLEDGQCLFYLGSPFSRPYIVPDVATESRLRGKLTWYHRIFLGTLIVSQPFLLPYLIQKTWMFFAFLAAVVALNSVVIRILFWTDLRNLSRRPNHVPLRTCYAAATAQHSENTLTLGFSVSLAFVVIAVPMLFFGPGPFVAGLTGIVFFGLCAIVWGYKLKRKRSANKLEKGLVESTHAGRDTL